MDVLGDEILRLLVATLLGAVVGFEREATDQPAGLRTHIAVSLGAAIFGVVSTLGFTEFEARRAETNTQIDVTRVASQVVVGIGFLGAGIIIRSNGSIQNLTTAASLWVTSAIGLASGVGNAVLAIAATLLLVLVLVALMPLRSFIRNSIRRPTQDLVVTVAARTDIDRVVETLRSSGLEVSVAGLSYEPGAWRSILSVSAARGHDLLEPVLDMAEQAGVLGIEVTAPLRP